MSSTQFLIEEEGFQEPAPTLKHFERINRDAAGDRRPPGQSSGRGRRVARVCTAGFYVPVLEAGTCSLCTQTHPHNFAPLLHVLPHGVDDVAAHVLPFSAFLAHPDQTHPDGRNTANLRTHTAPLGSLPSKRLNHVQ